MQVASLAMNVMILLVICYLISTDAANIELDCRSLADEDVAEVFSSRSKALHLLDWPSEKVGACFHVEQYGSGNALPWERHI